MDALQRKSLDYLATLEPVNVLTGSQADFRAKQLGYEGSNPIIKLYFLSKLDLAIGQWASGSRSGWVLIGEPIDFLDLEPFVFVDDTEVDVKKPDSSWGGAKVW